MRKPALLLLIGAAPALAPETAAAQSAITGPDPITVTGDNRVICRRVTRTATRMRIGRICRTQAQWRTQSSPAPPLGNHSNDTIDEAADTLDGLRADDRSTGCGYEGHETALGPR
ncbi:MAG TPA: hypothetical protein VGW40_13895 [Allosphingosinicella sp.]|nr:hypothetical protein [Allosphingosinicella sp.]